MDNPILLLVFWFVVNLFIKSAKDKKNIEESRKKRTKQIDKQPIQSKNISNTRKEETRTNSNKNKSIIEVFREEIEQEIQKERSNQQEKKQFQKAKAKEVTPVKRDTSSFKKDGVKIDEVFSKQIDEPKLETEGPLMQSKTQLKKPKLDPKSDVLKGVIFSEILSEPKGIKNLRRGM